MAIKSQGQVSLIDLTDAYSVHLTNEAHIFSGNTTGVNGTQTVQFQIIAMCGADQKSCSVDVSQITKPTGISISTDGKVPRPTITITASSAVTTGGTIVFPVVIPDDGITIERVFSYEIARQGNQGKGITSSTTQYAKSTSGTTAPTTGWQDSIPPTTANEFLWTRVHLVYSDNATSDSYSVSRNGAAGTSVSITSKSVEYATSTSGTSAPTSGWQSTVPTVAPNNFLWTKNYVVFSDGKTMESYAVSRSPKDGKDGAAGADAINMTITSSNGLIFKNTSIATVLTAHIFSGGVELTASDISELGTIKWYKNGSETPCGTGATLTISAGDVQDSANFVAELDG